MLNLEKLSTLFTLMAAAFSNVSSGQKRLDLFSVDISPRAGFYRSKSNEIGLIKKHFEQVLASKPGEQFHQHQLDLLAQIYQVSEVKKQNCNLQHFQHIQTLIERRAKFHFSSVPFLKYYLWAQFLICQDEFGAQLVDAYDSQLSPKQMEDLKLLYDKTTEVKEYTYSLLFDNISRKEQQKLISVLLDGSAAFMKFRGAHIWDIISKHDKNNLFAKEHVEIVRNFCLDINKPLQELMEVFNEAVVDRRVLGELSLKPKPLRVFSLVKICQRIIEHEDRILVMGHRQLTKNKSHLEKWLMACGIKSKRRKHKSK